MLVKDNLRGARCIGKEVRSQMNRRDDEDGLKVKYNVEKLDGTPVNGCFVLRPDIDLAARSALLAYADATENKVLAMDIRAWVFFLDSEDENLRKADPSYVLHLNTKTGDTHGEVCGEWNGRIRQDEES